MKTFKLFLICVIVYIASSAVVFAKKNTAEDVPPGMEVIYIGSTKYTAPKGMEIREIAGFKTLESINEYVGRKFLAEEKRNAVNDARHKELQEEVEKLKELLKETQKSSSEETNALRDEIKKINSSIDAAKSGSTGRLSADTREINRVKRTVDELEEKIADLKTETEWELEKIKDMLEGQGIAASADEEPDDTKIEGIFDFEE